MGIPLVFLPSFLQLSVSELMGMRVCVCVCVCVCEIPQSCRNVAESCDRAPRQMQQGSELGAAQEQVSQPKHQEVPKLMRGQSTNTCSNTTQHKS